MSLKFQSVLVVSFMLTFVLPAWGEIAVSQPWTRPRGAVASRFIYADRVRLMAWIISPSMISSRLQMI